MAEKDTNSTPVSEMISPQELQACQQEVQDWKQKYSYLTADFENFKRRSLKEYELMRTDAYARILKPILTIIDDFDRALMTLPQDDALRAGFVMIRKSFDKLLADAQVTEIETNGEFDPEKHEAIMFVQTTEYAPGAIVQVLQPGYKLKDFVLRPAKVSVAQE